LLIEEARTNLITYSEDFGNAYWTKNGDASVTANTHVAPDGTTTADTVTGTAGGSGLVFRTGFSSSGQVKSIWARTVSGTGNANIIVDQNSTLVSALTTDWKRIEISNAENDGGNLDVFYAVDFRGGGLEEVVLWGAQVVQGSPTSYIPTAGTQVTRAADDCTRTLGDELDHHEFTVYAEIDKYPASGTEARFLSLSDDTNANRITLREAGDSFIFAGSGNTETFTIPGVVGGSRSKIAYSFNNATRRLIFAVNGEVIFSTTTIGFLGPVTELKLNRGTSTTDYINVVFKDLFIFPTALSEAELITLTGGT